MMSFVVLILMNTVVILGVLSDQRRRRKMGVIGQWIMLSARSRLLWSDKSETG
jgi:hypothetical protein